MTADARVARSCAWYFGFATKVRSPASARSMPATRWISIPPSPSSRQSRRSAISRNFKIWAVGRRSGGYYNMRISAKIRRMAPLDLTLRLLVAAGLAGVVGLEREFHHKPAGLRTQILIGVGSALFTIMSLELGAE